ncbi:MAG: tetratricopeptide repeat protein [Chitinophagia bacterium]|nr:tetratricopeptide repeat protein [Chitinophagia bacterium]
MAKKQHQQSDNKPKPQVAPANVGNAGNASAGSVAPKLPEPFTIYGFKLQAIIVAALAFVLYINTYMNEYAHDDGIVIVKNEYVQEGFAGIPSILTKDAYDSYYKQLNTVNQLAGGRYRPLSMVTFAMEQQVFGAVPVEKVDSYLKQSFTYGIRGPAEQKLVGNMHLRHLFNVMWYMLCVVIVLYFLRYIIFPDKPLAAFVAAVIFTAHPIHTEVVANVKSRDEIMSLIFMCLTLIASFKAIDAFANKKNKDAQTHGLLYIAGGTVCYFLAFLSKEYAITLFLLLPLALLYFRKATISQLVMYTLPLLLVFGIYFSIRLKVSNGEDQDRTFSEMVEGLMQGNANSDKEILNNPYYFCKSPEQKKATQIATSINYAKLLAIPYPLSADYSYNTIPYVEYSHPKVWLSILFHLGLILLAVYLALQKGRTEKVISYSIAFYMVHLFMVNNLIFNIGATMGERLIFHSSVGFATIIAYALCKLVEKMQQNRQLTVLLGITGAITLVYACITIPRNTDWKNDKTLFTTDLKKVPNSVLVLGNVAASYISMADLDTVTATKNQKLHSAIDLLTHAISIHPTFVAGFLNKGIAYLKLNNIDSAQMCTDSVRKYYPNYPTLVSIDALIANHYLTVGWEQYGKFGKYLEAIEVFKKGLASQPNNPDLWYNVGGAYYSNKMPTEALEAWDKALQIKPDHQQALQGRNAALLMLQQKPVGVPNSPPPAPKAKKKR